MGAARPIDTQGKPVQGCLEKSRLRKMYGANFFAKTVVKAIGISPIKLFIFKPRAVGPNLFDLRKVGSVVTQLNNHRVSPPVSLASLDRGRLNICVQSSVDLRCLGPMRGHASMRIESRAVGAGLIASGQKQN